MDTLKGHRAIKFYILSCMIVFLSTNINTNLPKFYLGLLPIINQQIFVSQLKQWVCIMLCFQLLQTLWATFQATNHV